MSKNASRRRRLRGCPSEMATPKSILGNSSNRDRESLSSRKRNSSKITHLNEPVWTGKTLLYTLLFCCSSA
jgi:hypothetical protein